MRTLTVVLDDATHEALAMDAADDSPAAVGLVAAQRIAWSIEQDEPLPAG
jgi:hypothetical protein